MNEDEIRPREVTLDRQESILLYPTDQYAGDLTGTTVTTDQPVSVFGGHECTGVPDLGTRYCDQLTEMIPPVSTLGRRFVTVPLATKRSGERLRVLPAADGTELRIDGTIVATANRGEFYQADFSSDAYRLIETSEPSLVVEYATSGYVDRVMDSDPFMAMVPPVEQFAPAYVVSQPDDRWDVPGNPFYGN
ncbi:MAG: IgGFc-binding protein, partial [Deltaproteobacteria bacterium]|nr:IgGFc-binding protein [Deltaproteobacteria bacterium]